MIFGGEYMAELINRRERKKLHSKKVITQAALKLFGQQGFSDTSIADIMNEADLGIGTFYNYFQSKEDILKNLLGEMIAEIYQAYESFPKDEKSSTEFLSEVFLLTARILDKNRFVLPLFVSAAQKSAMIKEEQPAETESKMGFKRIFEAIIRRRQDLGEFRKDIPAEVITEIFHSVFQAAAFSRLELDFLTNVEYKLKIILDGIELK